MVTMNDKMHILFYAVLALLQAPGNLAKPEPLDDGCSYEFESFTCKFEVYCVHKLDIGFARNFKIHNKYFCDVPPMTYEGDDWAYIHLTLKDYHDRDLVLSDSPNRARLVTLLDLSSNEYTTFPKIVAMPNLKVLNFSRNYLTEGRLSNPNEIPILDEIDFSYNKITAIKVERDTYVYKKLKRINLSHNYLVDIEDSVFDLISDLEYLDLSFNFINSLSISTFEGIKNIVNFKIKHNNLSNIGSSLFRFSKLTELDLSENKIQSIKYENFEKLTSLQILDLSFNVIRTIDERAFSKNTVLKILNFKNNALEKLQKDLFVNISTLSTVDLSNNDLKKLPQNLFQNQKIINFSVKENLLEGSLKKGTFDGMQEITELDLSCQQLSTLEDFAFNGLRYLKTLLLNGNSLGLINKQSFKTLQNLETLDLSNNQLISIDFDKSDLSNLKSLLVKNNQLLQVDQNTFKHMESLEFLDLSYNNISTLEPYTFQEMEYLINFQISKNPISGTVKENTFKGLQGLPGLEITETSLSAIENGSFVGMSQMKTFNMSHNNITELQYNSFMHTGKIETIDLSFNQLKFFFINTSELSNLNKLILNNNILTTISATCFKGLSRLNYIVLFHNQLITIDDNALDDQKNVNYLDFSFNTNLKFNVSLLENAMNLDKVILSGVQSNITFNAAKEIRLAHLEMSYANISNITSIGLQSFINLNKLVLSNNNLSKVEALAFDKVTKLKDLDLSYNKINFIQSGAFRNNTSLMSLNISHNMLASVNYGILKGLVNLKTFDISFNEITDLKSERFYEVQSLQVLIADNNKITDVKSDDFDGTELKDLSIGGNPIPCHVFVNLRKTEHRFAITALKLEHNSDFENVDGVTCNMDGSVINYVVPTQESLPNESVLLDLKDTFQNMSESVKSYGLQYLNNLTNQLKTNFNQSAYYNLLLVKTFQQTASTKDNYGAKSFVFLEICVCFILIILIMFILLKLHNSGIFSMRNRHTISMKRLQDSLEDSNI